MIEPVLKSSPNNYLDYGSIVYAECLNAKNVHQEKT